ncbi:MAG TPA: GAF domain-containing protein [Candidatus Acidoferrum sp.]|jgi:GAF domain-containing protein|nr:GAF domain-containing protein [Candidatus Acidoferrum sp.]
MDQHSILDHNAALPAVEGDMPGTSASRSATASVSAGIAAASAHLPQSAEPGPRFPGEGAGRSLSLAETAHRDLDAALQLLAERAQYITGASGAAIALRRGEHNDMLCRASAGSNAPELGALLSMEYGLSGESVRTRQTLRCDDAERDPRVNREGCRQLGIASVVVMPVLSEQQVLGVFELFSGKPRAFEERDISALRRLSEMVETAVKHAVAAQIAPEAAEPATSEPLQPVEGMAAEAAGEESPVSATETDLPSAPPVNEPAPKNLPDLPPELVETVQERAEPEKTKPELKKPLFWSAAVPTPVGANGTPETSAVPPVLRNLQKCQACGFPVSQGRTFCVECEEKQWRGQPLPQSAAGTAPQAQGEPQVERQVIRAADVPEVSVLRDSSSARASTEIRKTAAGESAMTPVVADLPQSVSQDVPAEFPASANSTLFLSSAASSESWLAANKYVIGVLLVVAIVIGAIVWLR